jgi:hypothetical protein
MDARTVNQPSFTSFSLSHGVLADMSDDAFPTVLSAWADDALNLDSNATHFGYVYEGKPTVEVAFGSFALAPGMYFSLPGAGVVQGRGKGIVVSRIDYRGFFHLGGPTEELGRLKYIDGCTDSLLIPPIMLGDPCLNLLHFPAGVIQTQHTHPSVRVGLVAGGRGECETPTATVPLIPGNAFVIPTDGVHGFRTDGSSMTVIAYHPDSDFGPTHETHPMINRTIVEGVSASRIPDIRTK